MTTENPPLSDLLNQLWVFGDSYSDFGSRAAGLLALFIAPTPPTEPAWSGVTISNSPEIWQTILRVNLGIPLGNPTDSSPTDFSLITNSFAGGPFSLVLSSPLNPSYAVGGALTGEGNLLEGDPDLGPLLAGTGVRSQIRAALADPGVPFGSDELVTHWAGGNDLQAALGQIQAIGSLAIPGPIEGIITAVFNDILQTTKGNLLALLRHGEARQLLAAGLAPLAGEVDGVEYLMPLVAELDQGLQLGLLAGAANFHQAMNAMVAELSAAFPYANLVYFNPEFQASWEAFGDQFGNFADYGITNTAQPAQLAMADDATPYLWLDVNLLDPDSGGVHPTASGHRMLARGVELTLEAKVDAIQAASLTNEIIAEFNAASRPKPLNGTSANDDMIGSAANDKLIAKAGNDRLNGGWGDDFLNGGNGNDELIGGRGSDRMLGGGGADFFGFDLADFDLSAPDQWVDTIVDFNPEEGDRLGLSKVAAQWKGDLFDTEGWSYIGVEAFDGVGLQLRFSNGMIEADLDGDSESDFRIALLGANSFDADWIS
jgi:phospholipase/lecithinase/hemolysin